MSRSADLALKMQKRTGALFASSFFISLLAAPAIAQEYKAGLARIVITPQQTMWAGGYAARTQPVSETLQDLYAKALLLEDASGHRLLIITTDLLGLPRNIADPLAEKLGRRLNLRREQILLSSSHTHCGPVLRDSLVDIYPMGPDGWKQIHEYSEWLSDRVLTVAVEASEHMAPARLAQAVGNAGFAVNRRENPERLVVPGYTPKGPADHDVPILRVTAPDGTLRAVLFGYACHNTTMDFYKWCGDYAGFAQRGVEAEHPGATAMFFMGCGADSNPLPRRKIELCEKYGHELAEAVDRVLAGQMKPVDGPLAAAFRRVDVALAHVPTREELLRTREQGKKNEKVLAKRLLAQLDAGQAIAGTYPCPVQAIQFGRDLTLVAVGGEVVVDYSLRLKRELGPERTWVAGYCNDVFAYIPSRRVLAEGGYEGRDAMAVYGLPGAWAPSIEETLVGAVHELVGQVRGAASQPAS